MVEPSVVVIGGGAIGLSAALHLAELGSEVTLLEKEFVASGSSGLSVGLINTQYVDPLDIELRTRSMGFFNALERDEEFSITHNGYLRPAHSTEEFEAFEDSVRIQRSLGVTAARVLTSSEIKQIVPDMRSDDLVGGLFGANDGYIDGYLYCNLLVQLAIRRGVRVLTEASFIGREPGVRRTHRSITTAGDLESDFIVNAGGAWAGAIGEQLGTLTLVLPQRHQTTFAQLTEPLPYVMPCVVDYIPHSTDYGLYFRHDAASRLIVGLHSEAVLHELADPNAYNRSADHAFLEIVAEKFVDRLPNLANARLSRGWAGLYPVSPDGLPQVGPTKECDTIISACGVGGSGLQISPAIGRLVADWIFFGEPRSITQATRLIPSRESLAREVIRPLRDLRSQVSVPPRGRSWNARHC